MLLMGTKILLKSAPFMSWLTEFFFVCLFIFQDRVSLCSFGCRGSLSLSIDQAVLELTEIKLPLPPEC